MKSDVFFLFPSLSLEAEQSSSPSQPAAGSDCDDCHIATMGNVKDLALLKNTGHFYFSTFFCGHFCPWISKPFKTNTLTLEWQDKGRYSQTHLSKQVGKVLSLLSRVTRVAAMYNFTKVARDCTDFRDMYNFARYVAFIKSQTAVNMSCKPATWIVI